MISVPTEEIEVAVDWPDGAVHVFGADATVLRIDPEVWRSFQLAKDRVRQLVPPERWVVWRPDA